ncbi:MAG: ZIP family metal transporter, partial [Oscillospiraceae bacterium]|nr:ZIP family metal transporter [Oscillospiraceae bacterium]
IVLSFAAGVMLAAAVLGLILPSVEYGGRLGLLITVPGIFAGAVALNLIDRIVPHLHKMAGTDIETHRNPQLSKVLLFVTAIAIHNLPEGIAAGVGFGSGDTAQALIIAGGIALQNIPEGMVIIGPMLAAGVKPSRTFILAMLTGVVEVVGTLIGFFAVSLASAVLPFALAFAGGTMLYVISDEMIPETHAHGHERGATYALLVGFCLMLITDVLLG